MWAPAIIPQFGVGYLPGNQPTQFDFFVYHDFPNTITTNECRLEVTPEHSKMCHHQKQTNKKHSVGT